jgi:hypothetical protein
MLYVFSSGLLRGFDPRLLFDIDKILGLLRDFDPRLLFDIENFFFIVSLRPNEGSWPPKS